MRSRIRSGFTLIELLVVIAIIGILASMLFPVFAQAREKARSIVCIAYESQLGKALQMYCDSYDEQYPTQDHLFISNCSFFMDSDYGVPNWYNSPYANWAQAIYSNVTSREMYVCKSNKGWTTNSDKTQPGLSYVYNGYASGAALARVQYPSETIVLWDYRYLTSFAVANPMPSSWCFADGWSTHAEMFNILCFDGHAKSRPAGVFANDFQLLGAGQPNPFSF